MRIVFVHAQEVLAAQLFVTDVARDAAELRAALQRDAVHALHMRAHEVFVTQLLVANLAETRTRR